MDAWKFALLVTCGMIVVSNSTPRVAAYSCPENDVDFHGHDMDGGIPNVYTWEKCGELPFYCLLICGKKSCL